MASSSKSSGCGSRIEVPSADNAPITPQPNPEFEAMPGVEIIAHLSCSHRTSDFVEAARVLTARERRFTEAMAQIRQIAKIEMWLQAEIRAMELVRHGSSISGHRLTQQASVIKEAYGEEVDRKIVEHVLGARVLAGHEVPKEEAEGEDLEASHRRGSQEEKPARATKKARKKKD